MKFSRGLALRSVFFVFLLPGTVAVYGPLRILRSTGRLVVPGLSVASVAAAGVILAGAAAVLSCVWDFFAAGRGTLAPVDPPKALVVRGLYRSTRNPMYNGVLAMILGQSWLFRSGWLAFYAMTVFLGFHLFVVLYEERTLESRFGEAYRHYRRSVPRWGFALRREGAA
jgi:protein-S-isoprenylcysteine O-methyltransferase Ste14